MKIFLNYSLTPLHRKMVGTLCYWSKKLENKRSPLTNVTDRSCVCFIIH